MDEKINILVVDDNKENLKVVSNYLKTQGYNIALALDGTGALEILKSTHIDLILLDIMMPEMDGFEVCKKIKKNPETKDIPVIFLTAKNETEDIVRAFREGGVDYITKPFRKEELWVRVSNHVSLKIMRELLMKDIEEISKSRETFMCTLLNLSKLIK
jgi:CheY-like chemotaxis protein